MWIKGEIKLANTTRWKLDSTIFKIEEVITKLLELGVGNQEIKSRNSIYKNFKAVKLNKHDDYEVETFNDREIKYQLIQITFDKHTGSVLERAEIKQKILIYEDDNKLYIIIDKNTGAKTFLRLLLGFKVVNGIDEEKKQLPNGAVAQLPNVITSDLIVWLIYKVYSEDYVYEVNDQILTLDTIIAFKGDTEDKLSKVEAAGDSLMNILSTLSFLLEANSLNQITVRLTYGEHKKIEIMINVNDTLSVETKQGYKGKFEKDGYADISDGERYSLVTLLTYIEVLPLIKGWYDESIDDQIEESESSEDEVNRIVWGQVEHKNFLNKVAEDLTNKVKEKISTL